MQVAPVKPPTPTTIDNAPSSAVAVDSSIGPDIYPSNDPAALTPETGPIAPSPDENAAGVIGQIAGGAYGAAWGAIAGAGVGAVLGSVAGPAGIELGFALGGAVGSEIGGYIGQAVGEQIGNGTGNTIGWTSTNGSWGTGSPP